MSSGQYKRMLLGDPFSTFSADGLFRGEILNLAVKLDDIQASKHLCFG